MQRIEKLQIKKEIALYEEYPTAYNCYIAELLKRVILADYDANYIGLYNSYLLHVNTGNRQIDYEETKEEFLARWHNGNKDCYNKRGRVWKHLDDKYKEDKE